MALTDRQRQFVREYLIDLNATQAGIRAGYSARGARKTVNNLMRRPAIIEAIAEAQQERAQRTAIDADYVLRRLVEIDQMDVLDIMNDRMELKPVSEWPQIWRQYLSGFDVAEMFEGRGESRNMVGILKKIKWPDKVKNLELLGRHVNVQAFRERVEHTGADGGPIDLSLTVTFK